MHVCADDAKTRLTERMRTHVQWKWSVVNASCGAAQIIDVVIDVRVMECHASMDVAIGVRIV